MRRTDEIVEVVKDWINERSLQPGDVLPSEKDLISYFGASRGSVREALRALQYQGLVTTKRGSRGGTEIARVSYDRTAEFLRGYLYFDELSWAQIYEARALIEPRAVRNVGAKLTQADFAALEETIKVTDEVTDGDLEAVRQAEIEFHAILARRADNPLLSFMARFINSVMSELTVSHNVVDPGGDAFHGDNVRAHRDILAALRRDDGDAVEALMARHIEEAGCFVCLQEHARGLSLKV